MLIGPNHVEILAAEHFDEGAAAFVWDLGHCGYHYFLQPFDARRLDVSLIYSFKVVYISNLWGLSDAPPMLKPLPAVVRDGVGGVVGEAAEHEEGGDGGAGAAFACVAVHYHDVVYVL